MKKEAAHIRDLFREGDKTFRRQNIAKLLFFHMNGYPTDFGMTECIKLCASNKYSDKRVAYLGLMIIVDETEEILMLMTNCLQQDLHSEEVQTVSLALNVLGDIASVEMVRDLMPAIEKHLLSSNSYIRKKAALAAVRAVRKLGPEETLGILGAVPSVFDARSSAVHVSGTALVTALCQQSSSNIPDLQMNVTPIVINTLRDHLQGKNQKSGMGTFSYSDTVIGGVQNPFLQVRLISTIRQLVQTGIPGSLMESISDVLAQVASNTNNAKVAGCAVLYECVRTIISLNTEKQLRVLAVNILGKFLSHKDATVRYIALQELTRVIEIDGPGVLVNINGYKDKILSGLREVDPTVRKRAVELVYRMTSESNIEEIMKEVLSYIEKSESPDAIEDGCWKVFMLLDKYGPSDEWKVSTFVKALSLADMSMPEELITSFLALVSVKPHLQAHAVQTLFKEALQLGGNTTKTRRSHDVFESAGHTVAAKDSAGKENSGKPRRKPRLERVALYLLGEHGEVTPQIGLSIPQVLDAFERILCASEDIDEALISSRESIYDIENKVLREVALTGLVKFACRALTGASVDNHSNEEFLTHPIPGYGNESTVVSSILALPAPPKEENSASDIGLGTDLLASMGLGDEKPSKALIPTGDIFSSSAPIDPTALISVDQNVDCPSGNPVIARVRHILTTRSRSADLEIQQRACEYLTLLNEDQMSTLANTMAPMPCLNFESIQQRAKQRKAIASAKYSHISSKDGVLLDLLDEDYTSIQQPPALPAPGSELLSLPASGQGTVAAPSHDFSLDAILGGHMSEPQESLSLDDLIATGEATGSGEMTNELPQDNMIEHESSSIARHDEAIHSATLFKSEELEISASFYRDDIEKAYNTRAEVTFANKGTVTLHNFVFLLAVPVYMKLHMHPASSTEIGPNELATQSVDLMNLEHETRSIQLRYRVEYMHEESQDMIRHQGVVSRLDWL